jgi:hypothetical protein
MSIYQDKRSRIFLTEGCERVKISGRWKKDDCDPAQVVFQPQHKRWQQFQYPDCFGFKENNSCDPECRKDQQVNEK